MEIREYTIPTKKAVLPLRIALAADLHNNPHSHILRAIADYAPDLITIPGDLMNEMRIPAFAENNRQGLSFLKQAAEIAPTFYSVGNHEVRFREQDRAIVQEAGAMLLDNEAVDFKGIRIGGLTSGGSNRITRHSFAPDEAFLTDFSDGDPSLFRLLLCHNPEYYPVYLRHSSVDLVFSGHAHGGQWRIGRCGLYAPGQGIFPKYTDGLYEKRLVVSRGLGDTTRVPRFHNPHQMVFVRLQPEA